MNTYLLTWNPRRFQWDELADDIAYIRAKGSRKGSWSCGNTRRIQKGDRFFLIRLGQEPRGIVGSGEIISEPFEETHWDNAQAESGSKTLYVDVVFKALRDAESEAILPHELLRTDPRLSSMHWSPQSSGVRIPDNIAAELERLWAELLNDAELPLPDEVMATESFREGSVQSILVNAYERNPMARNRCIEHYGAKCVVCGFDFSTVYGTVGAGYIHVHHEKPLSEIREEYAIDPIRDLKPVCPNCHAIIHRRRPAYTIAELREIVHRSRTQ